MLSWFVLTLIAALFLGLYEVAKKTAVTGNAVAPVLLLNVTTAALVWSGPILLEFRGVAIWQTNVSLLSINAYEHLALFCKSALVGTSWMFAFVALKNLPISIASPVRATSPLWTIALAVAFMDERPSIWQWFGVGLILFSFLAFSQIGKTEGIRFHRSRAIWLMVIATLVSSFCGVYDKYLLQTQGLHPSVVQAWFSIYLVPVMVPMNIYWFVRDRKQTPFQWRWSIPMVALLLLAADYYYFLALSQPDAMIVIISPLRRCSIVIPFLFGVVSLKEKNWRQKLPCILILLAGVFMICLV